MTTCFFVSDLHGKIERYEKLFREIEKQRPRALFMGGDILPFKFTRTIAGNKAGDDFIDGYLLKNFITLKSQLGDNYPRIFLILGNDDARVREQAIINAPDGIWEYIHKRKVSFDKWMIYGYAHVPPTPFMLKDWERYDVSRYVDPGCYAPFRGKHTVPKTENELKYTTIAKELEKLAGDDNLEQAVFLFHAPPYQTRLDRAALDGKKIDGVPLDPHIGSIAIERFIKARQPLLTLHGHVHESTRLTGNWQDKFERTLMFNAAHDGPELSLIKFDLENPASAERNLL